MKLMIVVLLTGYFYAETLGLACQGTLCVCNDDADCSATKGCRLGQCTECKKQGEQCSWAGTRTASYCCRAGLTCVKNYKYVGFCKKVSTGSCLNTRDKGLGIRDKANTCVDQLDNGYSCSNLITWKDCDNYCNLCACSTASATRSEHCSGHGTCEATCTLYECTGAKCKCDAGWSGDKCQNRTGKYANIPKGTYCSGSFDEIPSEAECKTAAKNLGLEYFQTVNYKDQFPACYAIGKKVRFNKHSNPSRPKCGELSFCRLVAAICKEN